MSRVLVVDDDSALLGLVEATLASAGIETVATVDAHDAVRLAREVEPSAVLLDLAMPGVSGFDILAELKSEPDLRDVPVVVLSARSEGEFRIRSLREGAVDFVAKPFEPEELVLRVVRAVQSKPRGRAALRESAGEFGRYELGELIGEGAQGRVFRARDPRLDRDLAIKTILPTDSGDDRAIAERLEAEAKTLAKCQHASIVEIYDVGSNAGGVWIAMELVEGTSLREALRGGPLTVDSTIAIGLALAGALEAAHSRGILHFDVKPSNVLLGAEGGIKLVDFGLASAVDAAEAEGAIRGTPGYVAPESLSGSYSPASDLFSLGAVLYESLTGRLPFDGRTIVERIVASLRGRPPSIRSQREGVPASVEGVVLQLLERDPKSRPPSAAELRRGLRKIGPLIEPRWLPLEQARTMRLG